MDLKYCLYARKSTESDERQAMSIGSQIKEMTALAEREGLSIVEVKQESFSAKASSMRPIFNSMLDEVREGAYDSILTWAPDRLARNAGDLGSLVDLMDAGKLKQIRTFGQTFSDNPNEKFLLMILGSQAKLENDNKGLTVKRGMRAKAAMGWRPGNIPIGYINRSLNGRKDIIIDPARAPIIKEMFERVAIEKQSGRQLKSWLDEINFLTKRGKSMSLSQIYAVLQNTFYYGEFEYPKGGEMRKGNHTPIISKQLYEAVRRQIKSQTSYAGTMALKALPYRRRIRCGLCGNHMTPEETNTYLYYRCSGYSKEKARCQNASISLRELERQIIVISNQGKLKRSDFTSPFNRRVDQHYQLTKAVMSRSNIAFISTTRLRNYILYVFAHGTTEEKEFFFISLTKMPYIAHKKIFFTLHLLADTKLKKV